MPTTFPLIPRQWSILGPGSPLALPEKEGSMTPLRQRMIDDMKLRGLSANTRQVYLIAVRQLAECYRRPPDGISEEELRAYFLYLKDVRKLARSSITIAICGIKFFFERTLNRKWSVFEIVRPPRGRKLPVILARDEVRRILRCVRIPVYRVCLSTIYSCGLRGMEATQLQVSDVDGSRSQLLVHGKGGKDRYVPLPKRTLEILREHWKTHRSPRWLFPAPGVRTTRIYTHLTREVRQANQDSINQLMKDF